MIYCPQVHPSVYMYASDFRRRFVDDCGVRNMAMLMLVNNSHLPRTAKTSRDRIQIGNAHGYYDTERASFVAILKSTCATEFFKYSRLPHQQASCATSHILSAHVTHVICTLIRDTPCKSHSATARLRRCSAEHCMSRKDKRSCAIQAHICVCIGVVQVHMCLNWRTGHCSYLGQCPMHRRHAHETLLTCRAEKMRCEKREIGFEYCVDLR